jgi:hypothetical protein
MWLARCLARLFETMEATTGSVSPACWMRGLDSQLRLLRERSTANSKSSWTNLPNLWHLGTWGYGGLAPIV